MQLVTETTRFCVRVRREYFNRVYICQEVHFVNTGRLTFPKRSAFECFIEELQIALVS